MNIMKKYIQSILKAIPIIILAGVVGAVIVTLIYASGYFSYTRLSTVAKTLPNYENVDLSKGIKGEKPCEFHYDSSFCNALSIDVKTKQDAKVEIRKFISASQDKGLEWPEYKDRYTSIASHVFTRDGYTYQTYIGHEKDNEVSVVLVEY